MVFFKDLKSLLIHWNHFWRVMFWTRKVSFWGETYLHLLNNRMFVKRSFENLHCTNLSKLKNLYKFWWMKTTSLSIHHTCLNSFIIQNMDAATLSTNLWGSGSQLNVLTELLLLFILILYFVNYYIHPCLQEPMCFLEGVIWGLKTSNFGLSSCARSSSWNYTLQYWRTMKTLHSQSVRIGTSK
jgi:hypothetical protein